MLKHTPWVLGSREDLHQWAKQQATKSDYNISIPNINTLSKWLHTLVLSLFSSFLTNMGLKSYIVTGCASLLAMTTSSLFFNLNTGCASFDIIRHNTRLKWSLDFGCLYNIIINTRPKPILDCKVLYKKWLHHMLS
jgi:hypothetical protein